MKKIILFALVALFAVLSCSQYKYETVKGDPLKTKIYTLENGLQVYMTVNKETPRIQTYIAVKVGAKNDPLETTGLAHYFEHLMFKGTPNFGTSDYEAEKPLLDSIEALFEVYRKTTGEAERAAIYKQIDEVSYRASEISIPNEYDKLMSMIGADGTNAWTSSDETVYTEDIPSNQIDNWARIQADRFMNTVIRGFHTELETVYEEKNMSLTQDSRKVWFAIDQALFPHHPYGMHDVLGFQDHLKNPSIINIKNYHDQYYVPNNIRICVSGDFNPDEMVAAIEKYFGGWEPNPSIPVLEYEPEAPITEPIVREVYGLEAENLAIAWPLPGASDLKSAAVAEIASSILYNGQAGLIDLDVIQAQKALMLYAGTQSMPDYSIFLAMGRPKAGQTLEELRDIALEEVAKLRSGDFDEELIESTINNIKLYKMQDLENNGSRAVQYVNAFIDGVEWKDACKEIERYSEVTKDDIVAWANQYLGGENYAIVYKRMGEDKNIQKISAPKITPIATNRDKQSAFLSEIQNTTVEPIEPVFVDFKKDMSKFQLAPGVDVLYKKNELNDIAHLSFVFNKGHETTPELSLAGDYIEYLGTEEISAEEIAVRMYDLACGFSLDVSGNQTTLSISGLGENIAEALSLVESLAFNAVGDDDILASCKDDIYKFRKDTKLNQRSCASALQRYAVYGGDFIKSSVIPNDKLAAMTSDELLSAVRELFGYEHEILYYGPMSESRIKTVLKENHKVNSDLTPLEKTYPAALTTPENNVVVAPYDANQIYYYQYSNRGETFSPEAAPALSLYNEYFGGGMNTIVFQEMREARGLAYSAWAFLYSPKHLAENYRFLCFIATQNDKMQQAVEAFDEIINNMPESEAAFSIAKDALVGRLRTERTTGYAVLGAYRQCRELGIDEPLTKSIFEGVQDMTLEDVKATQQQWVKDRTYTYAILGDIKNLDTDYLKTLGPVREVTLEEIFGF